MNFMIESKLIMMNENIMDLNCKMIFIEVTLSDNKLET